MTAERLDSHLHETLAELRSREPVSWVPALDAWFVTSRALAVEVMRDAATFTVDDPRFSTAQVLGPSMLSLDGPEHGRHRDPFADAFRLPEVRRTFTDAVTNLAREIVTELQPVGRAELRRELAGPLAARVDGARPRSRRRRCRDAARVVPRHRRRGERDRQRGGRRRQTGIGGRRAGGRRSPGRSTPGRASSPDAREALTVDEIVSNTGVLLFGGIETTEGMTTNLFAHLLAEPGLWDVGRTRPIADRERDRGVVAARTVGGARRPLRHARYTSSASADIERGDFVIVMIAAANRDPAVFADPDRFDIRRANAKQHLTFAHGPHACLGMHLARLEAHGRGRGRRSTCCHNCVWIRRRRRPSWPGRCSASPIGSTSSGIRSDATTTDEASVARLRTVASPCHTARVIRRRRA